MVVTKTEYQAIDSTKLLFSIGIVLLHSNILNLDNIAEYLIEKHRLLMTLNSIAILLLFDRESNAWIVFGISILCSLVICLSTYKCKTPFFNRLLK